MPIPHTLAAHYRNMPITRVLLYVERRFFTVSFWWHQNPQRSQSRKLVNKMLFRVKFSAQQQRGNLCEQLKWKLREEIV